MNRFIHLLIFSKSSIRLILLAIILINLGIVGKSRLFKSQNQSTPSRGVVVTLIRSNNKSILLAINMINSIVKFHPTNTTYLYPFLIFHDQNFTSSMREQILSCIQKHNKYVQISFGVVNFQTKIEIDKDSRLNKPIEYRLMCRFWTYDVFYHPTFTQGQYDYLMRMDDDSYFSDEIRKDLFQYVENRKLDYIYRSTYFEPSPAMDPILRQHTNGTVANVACIYNNFFIIRVKWFYESKPVQNFLRDLMKDNLMLRRYTGDGCAHAAMLRVDKNVKVEHVSDIPYGHNFHLTPVGHSGWGFHHVPALQEDLHQLCRELRVLQGSQGTLTRINMY